MKLAFLLQLLKYPLFWWVLNEKFNVIHTIIIAVKNWLSVSTVHANDAMYFMYM